MTGIRARLAVTLVALVAGTATLLGLGAYAFVETSLRQALVTDARNQATFNLAVLVPSRLSDPDDREAFVASGLLEAFRLRGDAETIVDFGDGDPIVDPAGLAGLDVGEPLRTIVAGGELGYAWLDAAGEPRLVVAGRPHDSTTAFYFLVDASPLERALEQLRIGLLAGALGLVVVALLAARTVATGILRPVEAAGRAATRLAAGDLTARVPVGGRDEFARLATTFNAMADELGTTIERLRAAEAGNRRFVADVSHELRTPLTSLVAGASILEAHLDALPPDARRAGELLVADIGRLRELVAELIELSRFDAAAETVQAQPVDLARLVRASVEARLPGATVAAPAALVVATDARRFDRILGNLLDNAREHAPGAAVEVSLGRVGDTVRLEVADRGPGVAPEQLAHLFDRFVKADAARGGGSGLGLAIASEHARVLEATLTAEARVGGGMTFRLRLPVTESLPMGDDSDTSGDDARDG